MQLNAEEGENRKFIMVQWSEKTDEKSKAYKVGYKNIYAIGKKTHPPCQKEKKVSVLNSYGVLGSRSII